MSKLKINIDKLKNKFKLFKDNRFKALLGATLIAATLSSCNTNTNTNNNSSNSTTYIQTQEEKDTYFTFNMNFDNITDEIKNTELITVLTNDGVITNTINVSNDGISSALNTKSKKMYSNYLNQEIEIPEINDGEKFVVNVDYATKEITTSVENIVKTK